MRIHFIGIGGIGVSALARYYLVFGHRVSGSDLVSSEITDSLKKLGAKIFIPHQSKLGTGQVGKHKLPDLVIYSPAIPENNPELRDARRLGIKCLSYPEALGELTKKHFTIAVCGSHGKSTVAAMIGLILIKAGLNPTVIVGTKVKEFGDSNFRMGGKPKSKIKNQKSKILVIEADEYKESFLNYWPKIIVLTTLEPDHLDYYKNFKNYLLAFKKFISHLPKEGILIANKDDKNICNTISTIVRNIIHYSLRQKETKKIKKILKVPGEFNVSNALATLAVARTLSVPDKISFKALSEYRGSWRRFEITKILHPKPYILISDYAHHPTQIKVTLEAAREKYPNRKIWCIFQPHQYQRTYYLFKEFVEVLKNAPVDKLIITDIYDVAGRENKKIKKKVDSKKLVKAINKPFAIYLPKQKILKFLKKNLEGSRPKSGEPRSKGAGEVVIIMGAGDIYKLCKQF
jgi:UDP-N-acetylmuramate--alanine ligase